MKTMQRLGLTVLGLVMAAQFAIMPALGRKLPTPTWKTYPFALVPPPTEPPEAQASGRGIVEGDPVIKQVSVSCRRLSPNQQYHLMIYVGGTDSTGWPINSFVTGTTCTTDKHGNLDAQITLYSGDDSYIVNDVWIENDAGEVVLALEWRFKK